MTGGLTAKVSILDTEVFGEFLQIVVDMLDDPKIPDEVKEMYTKRFLQLCADNGIISK